MATPDSQFTSTHKRYLDIDKINSSSENATELGAQYAEIIIVMLTDSLITNAREFGKSHTRSRNWCNTTSTCRRFGVHSTTDISSILGSQIESTVKLAKAERARRSKNDAPINLAEVPIIEDQFTVAQKRC